MRTTSINFSQRLLSLVATGVAVCSCQTTVSAQDTGSEARPPNILFYILDDVGLEPMPQYPELGMPKAVTPTMNWSTRRGRPPRSRHRPAGPTMERWRRGHGRGFELRAQLRRRERQSLLSVPRPTTLATLANSK